MDGPPTRMMYSPAAGAAARELSANIDKNETSRRRFIIRSRELFMLNAKFCKWYGAMVQLKGVCVRRRVDGLGAFHRMEPRGTRATWTGRLKNRASGSER